MRWCLVVGMLLWCGCGAHERHESLAEIASSGEVSIRVTADGTDVTVRLRDAVPRGGVGCLVLDGDVHGALDGMPMELVSQGAYVPPPATDAASGCDLPTFHLAAPVPGTSETSHVLFTDGTTQIEAEVASLRSVREFTAEAAMHPGEIARLAWSVPEDAIAPEAGVVWSPEQGEGFALGEAFGASGVSVADGALVFSIPADAATGPGELVFSDSVSPRVVSCRDVVACEVEPVRPPPLSATMAP